MNAQNKIFLILLFFSFTFSAKAFYQNDSLKKDSVKTVVLDTVQKSDTIKTQIPVEKKEDVIAYDTLFKKNGFAILCSVKDKNLFEVKYIKKDEKLVRVISTRDLKSINYASGKIDLIDNNPEKSKKDWVTATSQVEWKKIKCYTDESSLAGMNEIGVLDAEYEAQKITMGDDLLEKNGIAIVQKKAYNMKGEAVLILSKDIKREYGELPRITIKAKVFAK